LVGVNLILYEKLINTTHISNDWGILWNYGRKRWTTENAGSGSGQWIAGHSVGFLAFAIFSSYYTQIQQAQRHQNSRLEREAGVGVGTD
jgi:hypothetical protein